MNFQEMQSEAELLYESIDSSDAPGFTGSEWGRFFTIAQRKVVLKILREGVNRDAFNMLAIEKLIKPDSYTFFVDSSHFRNTNGTIAKTLNVVGPGKPFNSKFFWVLDEYVNTTTASNVKIIRITYDFYRSNLDNPFRVPDKDEGFWMMQYNNLPVFITDGSVLTGYYVVAVEHPDNYPIVSGVTYDDNASCLNVSVHPRIVEEAVTLARMSVVDAQGYQLALAEFAK